MTREEALRLLNEAGIPNAGTDVRRLFEHSFLSVGEKIGGQGWDTPNHLTRIHFAQCIRQRLTGKPVSQIVGGREFWKYWFKVTPDVLDPRPETETLVELALEEEFSRALDIGTGSGCILISLLLERPNARGVGTDISDKAVLVAGENARFHRVDARITLPISTWFDDVGSRYDLIVSNPPYIAANEMDDLQPEVRDHEPRVALTDEADGLTAYRIIAEHAPNHLRPGGRLLVETGHTQGDAVKSLFKNAGLQDVCIHKDLDGRDRVVLARAKN